MQVKRFAILFGVIACFMLLPGTSFAGNENEDWSILRDAVRNGDLKRIDQLIDKGVDINHQDKAGWTVLHWWNFSLDWSYKNFTKTLDLLIKRGADVNATDIRGRTALMLLLVPGDDQPQTPQLEAIKTLIDAGTDLYKKNKSGQSVISLGLESRFPEVRNYFKKLKKAGSSK